MFGSRKKSGLTCWFCKNTPSNENIAFTANDIKDTLTEKFPNVTPVVDINNTCICTTCEALMRAISSDLLKAKDTLHKTGEKIKAGTAALGKIISAKSSEIKDKATKIKEERQNKEENN